MSTSVTTGQPTVSTISSPFSTYLDDLLFGSLVVPIAVSFQWNDRRAAFIKRLRAARLLGEIRRPSSLITDALFPAFTTSRAAYQSLITLLTNPEYVERDDSFEQLCHAIVLTVTALSLSLTSPPSSGPNEYIHRVPSSVLSYIFAFLPPTTEVLARCYFVCRYWQRTVHQQPSSVGCLDDWRYELHHLATLAPGWLHTIRDISWNGQLDRCDVLHQYLSTIASSTKPPGMSHLRHILIVNESAADYSSGLLTRHLCQQQALTSLHLNNCLKVDLELINLLPNLRHVVIANTPFVGKPQPYHLHVPSSMISLMIYQFDPLFDPLSQSPAHVLDLSDAIHLEQLHSKGFSITHMRHPIACFEFAGCASDVACRDVAVSSSNSSIALPAALHDTIIAATAVTRPDYHSSSSFNDFMTGPLIFGLPLYTCRWFNSPTMILAPSLSLPSTTMIMNALVRLAFTPDPDSIVTRVLQLLVDNTNSMRQLKHITLHNTHNTMSEFRSPISTQPSTNPLAAADYNDHVSVTLISSSSSRRSRPRKPSASSRRSRTRTPASGIRTAWLSHSTTAIRLMAFDVTVANKPVNAMCVGMSEPLATLIVDRGVALTLWEADNNDGAMVSRTIPVTKVAYPDAAVLLPHQLVTAATLIEQMPLSRC